MDPLTASSLAAGIIQLVDFSIRAVNQCQEIYKTGATAATQDAREQAESLRQVCAEVKNTSTKGATISSSQLDNDILCLAAKCTGTAEELTTELDQLNAKSKRDIIPKFFRGARKTSFIKEMQQKLEGYQNTLNLSILVRLDTSSVKQASNLESLQGHIMHLIEALDDNRRSYQQIVVNQNQYTRDHISNQHQSTREHVTGQNQSTRNHITCEMQAARQNIAEEADLVKQLRNLSMLPVAHDASFKSSHWQHEAKCHPDTRVELIQEIMAWSNDQSSDRILWLNGMAGTGKSTLARTIAQKLDESHRLAASFFFSRDKNDLSEASKLITTLANQMACSLPVVKPYISKAIEEDHNIFHHGLREQWKSLILKPLCQVQDPLYKSQTFVIVIDALDECQSEKDIQMILALLSELQSLEQVSLMVFLTSRPEQSIRAGFDMMRKEIHLDVMLHSVAKEVIEKDILVYLQHEFSHIREQRDMPAGWPSQEEITLLSENAMGLFIFASTACRFVYNSHFADKCLKSILEGKVTPKSPFGQLDAIYTQILKASVSTESDDEDSAYFIKLFHRVVGSIVNLQNPLPSGQLAELLQCQQREVHHLLQYFHSVLDVSKDPSQSIRSLHPSFHDFLVNEKRCYDKSFHISEESAHELLFDCCLEQMAKHLRRDMCKLQNPGFPANEITKNQVDDHIPIHVQYACRFWIYHFEKSNVIGSKLTTIYSFFCTSFLYWLECLSLQKAVSESVSIVSQLELLIKSHLDPCDSSLIDIVRDAKRFVLSFKPIIQQAPLQAYCSALLFAPERSIIKQQFQREIFSWVQLEAVKPQGWGSALQVLEGHRSVVTSVVFSPDSRMIASIGWDAIRLWNLTTGETLHSLDGHSGEIFFVQFSKDGRVLASTSGDKTIRLWDVHRGVTTRVLECYTEYRRLTTFSHDSRVIASSNYNSTIRLWDVTTGDLIRELDCPDEVFSIDFVPDGSLLVSSPKDGKIDLWDAISRRSLQLLEFQYDDHMVLVLSPDGKRVALADGISGKIQVFHVATGFLLSEIEGTEYEPWLKVLEFSSDSNVLAWATTDSTVERWDICKQDRLQTLRGHSGLLSSIAFSPDGQLLASGANDATIRLWSTIFEQKLSSPNSQLTSIRAHGTSSDGRLLAYVSTNDAIRIYEVSTGRTLDLLEIDLISPIHHRLIFSPDNQTLAFTDTTSTRITLWIRTSGDCYDLLSNESNILESFVFSPDSRLIASTFGNYQIRLWTTNSGILLHTVNLASYFIPNHDTRHVITFSPDGGVLAYCCGNRAVMIDASTYCILMHFEGLQRSTTALAFSPDGSRLVSGDRAGGIHTWDATTGSLLTEWGGPLTGEDIGNQCTHQIRSLKFSPNGRTIIAMGFETLFIYNTATGSKSEFSIVFPLQQAEFSLDNKYLMTNLGRVEINCDQHGKQTQTMHWKGLTYVPDWVQWEGRNLLWIPPDYRGHHVQVHNDTVLHMSLSETKFVRLRFLVEDPRFSDIFG